MKVLISVDIEGCVGIVAPLHTSPKGDDYNTARVQMSREASAAVEGCLEAGADEVVVNDSHGPKTNLVLEEIHPTARIITGTTKLLGMMEGIGKDCDASMYIGYHTGAGVCGTLSHTMRGNLIYAMRMNGQPCCEFDINAAIAGELGVPSILVSGDDLLEKYINDRYPQVHTASVKEYCGRNSANSLHPLVAQQKIKEAAASALSEVGNIEPVTVDNPVIEIDLMHEVGAMYAELIPGVERISSRSIRIETKTAIEAYKMVTIALRVAVHNP
jgi:D-amino peptidase